MNSLSADVSIGLRREMSVRVTWASPRALEVLELCTRHVLEARAAGADGYQLTAALPAQPQRTMQC